MPDKIEKITSEKVAEPDPNIFSNALKVGDVLYVSGMTAANTDGGMEGGDDAYGQARACFSKVQAMVEAASGSLKDVVKLTIYLTDMNDRPALGRARAEFFDGRMPCSTLVGISTLVSPAMKVEVEAIAHLGAGS